MSVVSEPVRRRFAEDVRKASGLPATPAEERIFRAFSKVQRERFVGKGPWQLTDPHQGVLLRTNDSNPDQLYRDVLVTLDERRGIAIGLPSMWAKFLWSANPLNRERVLQVGAGSGYYTAILSELVGNKGSVVATEIEPHLCVLASKALADCHNVSVLNQDATSGFEVEKDPFDLIVAFAGATHPLPHWQSSLKPDGRILAPITDDEGCGAMVLFRQSPNGFVGEIIGTCRFYPCLGARHPDIEADLKQLRAAGELRAGVQLKLHMDEDRATYEVIAQPE